MKIINHWAEMGTKGGMVGAVIVIATSMLLIDQS